MKNENNLSKELCYILRHHPEEYNLKLNKYGYADIDLLSKRINIPIETIKEIVSRDKKTRYTIKSDKIKCNFGHSISVELEPDSTKIPGILYHGTTRQNLSSINNQGIKPMSREYVHLTNDLNVAKQVGMRYARNINELIILKINVIEMIKDKNNILSTGTSTFLTKYIDPKYLIGVIYCE